MYKAKYLALVAAAAAACGTTNPDMESDLVTEPPAKNGMQIILAPVKDLEPGTSHEICTWTDHITETDLDLKAAKGFQTKLGHHVIMFYTEKKQPPGTTRECTEEDMTSFRFGIGTGGEGVENVLPGNLVYHIPKGVQMVINHHYLNATLNVATGQSAINFTFADPAVQSVRAGNIAFVNTALKIPTGRSTMDIKCTMNREHKMWRISPHMHRWGTYTTVDIIPATPVDAKPERLIAQKWQEDFTFHPPELYWSLDQPRILKPGDQVLTHCEWDNTTGKSMTFGMEMCVAFGQSINAENLDNIACDNGEWTTF